MPKKLREIQDLIKRAGCTIQTTKKGHFLVLNKKGVQIASFAATHGKKTKRDEVLDVYVKKIKKALEHDK